MVHNRNQSLETFRTQHEVLDRVKAWATRNGVIVKELSPRHLACLRAAGGGDAECLLGAGLDAGNTRDVTYTELRGFFDDLFSPLRANGARRPDSQFRVCDPRRLDPDYVFNAVLGATRTDQRVVVAMRHYENRLVVVGVVTYSAFPGSLEQQVGEGEPDVFLPIVFDNAMPVTNLVEIGILCRRLLRRGNRADPVAAAVPRGLASFLMAYALAKAQQQKRTVGGQKVPLYTGAMLTVSLGAANAPAVALYNRFGFMHQPVHFVGEQPGVAAAYVVENDAPVEHYVMAKPANAGGLLLSAVEVNQLLPLEATPVNYNTVCGYQRSAGVARNAAGVVMRDAAGVPVGAGWTTGRCKGIN